MNHSNVPMNDDELHELIHAVCDGRATQLELQRFNQLMLDDPQRQWLYLRYAHLQGSLCWDGGSAAEWDALRQMKVRLSRVNGADAQSAEISQPSDTANAVEAPRLIQPGSSHFAPSTNALLRRGSMAILGLALVMLLSVVALWVTQFGRVTPSVGPPIAVLASAVDAVWDLPIPPQTGQPVGAGKLRLAQGLARFNFENGAVVTLQGPAEFEIISPRRALLHSGRLAANAPNEAIGFRIDSPTMTLVDLGTAFGVSVAPTGDSQVCVFEGEVFVSLSQDGKKKSASRVVNQGEAVVVESGSARIDDTAYDPTPYEDCWPVNWGVLRSSGVVRFDNPGPPFRPHEYEDNDHIIAFFESDNVPVTQDIAASINEPGEYRMSRTLKTKIAKGGRVRSYLLQFNPVGIPKPSIDLQGTITFDSPVVGLIGKVPDQVATDDTFGNPDFVYRDDAARGLEGPDYTTLTKDRRTLIINWRAGASVDQLRVLVACKDQEP